MKAKRLETPEVSKPEIATTSQPAQPVSRRRSIVVAGCVAAASLFAYLYQHQQASRQASRAVPRIRTAAVRLGDLLHTIRLTGTTESTEFAQLRAPYLRGMRSRGGSTDFGLVLTQLVEPGAKVRKGDVVAAFDSVRMRDRLDDLRAERLDLANRRNKLLANRVVQREAHDQELRTAKAAMEFARLDLRTAAVVAAIQAEKYRLSAEEAREVHRTLSEQTRFLDIVETADVRTTELSLDAARAEERRAEINLERMVVRAPIDGMTVMQQVFRNGEAAQVRNGDQLGAGQPYLQIVHPDSLLIQATVSQSDITRVRVGAPVAIEFDAYPGIEATGRLKSIGSMAQGSRFSRLYFAEVPVTISLDTSDPRVVPGLSASADVVVASEPQTRIIPREAVFPDDDSDDAFSFVRRGSGWEKCPVKLGLTNNLSVSVRSGLDDGDVVALEQPAEWSGCTGGATTQQRPQTGDSGA